VRLHAITSPHLFCGKQTRAQAVAAARAEISALNPNELLCDGLMGFHRADQDEEAVWQNWTGPRLSPKKILGEGLTAAAAWQCVAAVDALQQNKYASATTSVAGCNEQAIAAQFVRCSGAL
jgi:hypothetical protein